MLDTRKTDWKEYNELWIPIWDRWAQDSIRKIWFTNERIEILGSKYQGKIIKLQFEYQLIAIWILINCNQTDGLQFIVLYKTFS